MKKIVSLIAVLALSTALLAGCGGTMPAAAQPLPETEAVQEQVAEVLDGGVLCLKVNPEIALHYDAEGKVVKLEGRNPEGTQILENIGDCTGKDTQQVLEELVTAIGKAGYFVEEVDGEAQRIVLELETGSCVPSEQFLHDMAAHVKSCVERRCWVDGDTAAALCVSCREDGCPGGENCRYYSAPAETDEACCPVCYDDDCDDGQYCDDYDERTENEQEAERRQNATPCGVCGEYDCDDGIWCDDRDERHENGHNNSHNSNHSGHNGGHHQ